MIRVYTANQKRLNNLFWLNLKGSNPLSPLDFKRTLILLDKYCKIKFKSMIYYDILTYYGKNDFSGYFLILRKWHELQVGITYLCQIEGNQLLNFVELDLIT